MLGFFTYPHKVANGLFRLGWTPDSLPPISNSWLQMIHALRKSGITPERAARELDLALQGDRDSLEWVTKYAGMYGTLFFGTEKDWDDHPGAFLVKPPK